ncbi:MAG: tetraacyldisaccharide 4'-kinase [Rhodanobacteraceae bacterium]|nr:tetraacyldisaccharide 4'-kinase [Rhodanobacteraceae bacterium]
MPISPERLQSIWYGGAPAPWWLRALTPVYATLRGLAQLPYRLRLRRPARLDAPVVVVGNLTVGGTGKTPLVIALVEALRARGWIVGVVSRGYGRKTRGVRLVDHTSTAAEVGDEPLLIAQRTKAPVAVGEDRVEAARRLLGVVPLDVLIADDGLEHLALPRCCEIVVIDGQRGFGNGAMLPAGPLRAPLSRLNQVDLRVRNGGQAQPGERTMSLRITGLRPMAAGPVEPVSRWAGRRAHVVAGTGNPERVFASAREIGIEVIPHPLPDHVDYASSGAPSFDDDLPCLTTAKDAVKLPRRPGWYVMELGCEIDPAIVGRVVECVERSAAG